MQIKKITALVLFVLIAAAALFAACKSGKDNVDTYVSSGPAEPTATEYGEITGSSRLEGHYWPDYGDFSEYAEMRETLSAQFVSKYIDGSSAPFSFSYDGLPSALVLKKWERSVSVRETDQGTLYTVSYLNPTDGMKIWAEFILYNDYPTLEWTAYAENTGDGESGTISDFMGMNVTFSLDSINPVLHTSAGSLDIGGDDLYDFSLVTQPLSSAAVTYMPEENDGRSSEHAWPFFDVVGDNCGLMVGIGWTGVWKASFVSSGKNVSLYAGMAHLSAYLNAGEKIRTPLYSVTYFDGDAEYGHNLFRRVVLAHYTPDDGTDDRCILPVSVSTESYGENAIIEDVSRWLGKLSINNVWTDAAWFGNTDVKSWSSETGNWWVNTARYPSGSLRKVSDFLSSNSLKYTVWFELERAAQGTELARRKELLLKTGVAGSYILNLASEDGYKWAEDYLVSVIRENNITVYRQDFNSPGVARAWAGQDESGRTGITEIRYVENMYRLYDTLLETFPGIMLDNCASGGKRIDLEMLKRMVVLHRTDYTCVAYGTAEGQWNMEGVQSQTQNISYWLPLHGSSVGYPVYLFNDSYVARSLLSPGVSLGIQLGYAADNVLAQKITKEMSDYRGYFIGDYYGLTDVDYTRASQQAFMYVRQDLDEGILLVFNRPESADPKVSLSLKGLDPDTYYVLKDKDAKSGREKIVKGSSLMQDGISMTVYPGTAKIFLIYPAYE